MVDHHHARSDDSYWFFIDHSFEWYNNFYHVLSLDSDVIISIFSIVFVWESYLKMNSRISINNLS